MFAGRQLGPPIGPRLFRKNSREQLCLSIDDYKGKLLLSCRIWYSPTDGAELRPGRDGWAMPIGDLPAIVEALQQLEDEARAAGLLE